MEAPGVTLPPKDRAGLPIQSVPSPECSELLPGKLSRPMGLQIRVKVTSLHMKGNPQTVGQPLTEKI